MARGTKRVKMGHDSTAAYAASQPLFDVLKLAAYRTTEQHEHLANARDVVQHTHAKLADAISDGDASQNMRYIDSAIKAWRCATASYAEIFNALAKSSAAEPSEGKPMREGHDLFVKMANMAAEANSMAESFMLYEQKYNGQPEHIVHNDGASEDSNYDLLSEDGDGVMDDDAEESTTNYSTSKHGQPLMDSGAFSHVKAKDKSTKTKQRMEEAREKHEKKLYALRAKLKQTNIGPGTSTTSKRQASDIHGAGIVEYQDVSEQVQSRLNAKQARREAAKKEKKRKRDSVDSLGVNVREHEVVAEKPAKKRTKSEGTRSEVPIVAVREKRQRHGEEADDGVGERTNKRAKIKG